MSFRAISSLAVILISLYLPAAVAADLRISLPQTLASEANGVWYKLSRAIAREWKEGKVIFLTAATFEKSIENVTTGKADVHFPLMQSPARAEEELPFRYSSFTTSETPFVLFVLQGSDLVERNNLTIAKLSKRRIETDMAHAGLFFSSLHGVENIEVGLQRVSAGQSDGFLYSARPAEAALKRLKLDKLVRVPYRRVQDKFVLPKGLEGAELDEKLSLIIDRLKDTGEFQKIMAPKMKEAEMIVSK